MTIQNLANGRPNNVSSFNTSSVSPQNGSLVLIAIFSRFSSGGGNTPSISGLSATWSQIDTEPEGGSQGLKVTLFIGLIRGNQTGAITVTFGGQTQTDSVYSIEQITGADIRRNGLQAIIQSVKASVTSTSNQTLTLSAFKNPRNIGYAAFFNGESGVNPSGGAGLTVLMANAAALTEYKLNTTSLNYSYVGPNDSCGIAIEIGGAKHAAVLGAFL